MQAAVQAELPDLSPLPLALLIPGCPELHHSLGCLDGCLMLVVVALEVVGCAACLVLTDWLAGWLRGVDT